MVFPNIPIIFIRFTLKNARCNRKLLDEFFHTRILEVGIKFSMKTFYHLDTLKPVKEKTLSYVMPITLHLKRELGMSISRDEPTDLCSQVRKLPVFPTCTIWRDQIQISLSTSSVIFENCLTYLNTFLHL